MADIVEAASGPRSDLVFSEHSVPRFSLPDERNIVSPTGSTSEQSDSLSTAKTGKLSRRATFAPALAESLEASPMQPLLLQHSNVAKQPSVTKQTSVGKQSRISKQSSMVKQVSIAKQASVAKQSSIPKQSSMLKQPSVASQASIVSQSSTMRFKPTDPSRAVPLSTRRSIETSKAPTRRSSAILQSKKSLQSLKTVKIDDMLYDYKFAVERRAKPAEAHAGQHALELDEAMQKLTLEWIVKTFVRPTLISSTPLA